MLNPPGDFNRRNKLKLLLLKYNNYYNRILKGYANIDGYKLAVGSSGYKEVGNVNFNPRDGVNTTHTVNTDFDFDYMLVFDDAEPYTIRSRWFAIDSQYQNGKQRTVTLRRDVLYDYSGSYGTAPAFIEKGAVASSDSAIYNLENMTFNQVLTSTTFIKDVSGRAWIACYLAKDRTEEYTINLGTETSPNNIVIPKSSASCNQPYDLLLIPPDQYKITVSSGTYTNGMSITTYAMKVAGKISKALTSGGVLYDMQYVPFTPLVKDARWTVTSSGASSSGATSGFDYIVSTSTTPNERVIMVFSGYADFNFTSSFSYDYDLSSAVNVKVDNETRLVRLLSPNSGSVFEFSPAKLGLRGSTNTLSFNIKCTYKPYSPYIHIYPTFDGLYGASRSPENRGLICGGDFSLPLLNDSWSSYEIRNKNYMNAFNRQIENMEIQQDYQRAQQMLGIATGAIGGAVGGAVLGGGVGGVVGGLASVAGGIADYAMSEKLRTEALDYTKDMFGYNLQNIRALPVALGRVGSTVIDSFIYPAVEIYTATSEEVTALTEKIKWNGMTVGRIGTFNDFKSRASTSCRYIKAKIIRLADLHEELHTANAISEELYKGVYIY